MNVKAVVHSDSGILGGTPVFVGTRVPVRSLFDYLEAGDTLEEFLRQFPSVKREQAVAAVGLARDALVARARAARGRFGVGGADDNEGGEVSPWLGRGARASCSRALRDAVGRRGTRGR